MSMPEGTRNDHGDDEFSQLLRDVRKQAKRFWAFLKSRSSECWIFFAAGLVVGLLAG